MNNRYGGARRQNQGPAPNEIGAAWWKQTQDGANYLSVQFNENVYNFDLANCFIDLYENEHKRNPNAPDYRVKAKPKQQRQQGQAPQRRGPPRGPQQMRGPAPQAPRPAPRPRNFAPGANNAPADEPPLDDYSENDFAGAQGDDGGEQY